MTAGSWMRVMAQGSRVVAMAVMVVALSAATAATAASGMEGASEEDVWHEIYTLLYDGDDSDEEAWNEAYDVLTTMALTPQNINEASYDDLNAIPFVTHEQALAVVGYITLYGDMATMAELSLIPEIDVPRRMILQTLFFAAPTQRRRWSGIVAGDSVVQASTADSIRRRRDIPQWRRNMDYGKHTLQMSLSIPTYRRKGYTDGKYLGEPYSHTVQYAFRSRNVEGALTAAQDAGEEFFCGSNRKGWDFYSGYVRLKNMGVLRNLVVGHYQMSVGMGLLVNNTWRMSKSSVMSSPPKEALTLRGHGSRQSANYFQGVAATLQFPLGSRRHVSLTPFAAYQAVDATMTERGTIQTLLKTGYHRTASETERRGTARQTVAGASVCYEALPLRVSVNVLHVAFSDSLTPQKNERYKYYSPTGKQFTSASTAYSFRNGRWDICGETALSQRAPRGMEKPSGLSLATANSVRYVFNGNWRMFLLQRHYSFTYRTLFANSFGDMANGQNESGIYLGATTTTLAHLTLSAYVDAAYHPWARYGYKQQSRSFDAYISAAYIRGNVSATARYRYREKAATDVASFIPTFTAVNGTSQHSLNTTVKYKVGRWNVTGNAQGCMLPAAGSYGMAAMLGGGYKAGNWTLWLSEAYFNTTDYDSRLYLTDKALSYGQMATMVYGRGLRGAAMVQYELAKRLKASLRCVSLRYLSRDKISSGEQEIDSPRQTDIQVQVRWTF